MHSNHRDFRSVIPQGSVLEPMYFVPYINNFFDCIGVNMCKLFCLRMMHFYYLILKVILLFILRMLLIIALIMYYCGPTEIHYI